MRKITVKHDAVGYPLGSPSRRLETLVLLVAPFLAIYFLIARYLRIFGLPSGSSWAVACLMLIPAIGALLWNGFQSRDTSWRVPWLSAIAANLAHGAADEDGIHFRKWFHRRFVEWRGIESVEYWPDRDGRIALHLFSQATPIIFVPELAPEESGPQSMSTSTVDFISRKLSDTWPHKPPFTICYSAAQDRNPLTVAIAKLPPRQRAWLHALGLALTLTLFYGYMALRWSVEQYYLRIIGLLFALALILWLSARVGNTRKAQSDPHSNTKLANTGTSTNPVNKTDHEKR